MTKNTKQSTHTKDLLLLFGVPLGVVLLAAAAIYIPRLLANPQTDFVYTMCESYACQNSFEVDDSGDVSETPTTRTYGDYTATLHYYDASEDSTKTITPSQAKQYTLNTSSKSPEGYSLVSEGQDVGFLFWSNYDSGWYLEKGAIKKPVELGGSDPYYSRDIKFLGWVE